MPTYQRFSLVTIKFCWYIFEMPKHSSNVIVKNVALCKQVIQYCNGNVSLNNLACHISKYHFWVTTDNVYVFALLLQNKSL